MISVCSYFLFFTRCDARFIDPSLSEGNAGHPDGSLITTRGESSAEGTRHLKNFET